MKLAAALSVALALSACGDGGTERAAQPTPTATSKAKITVLSAGDVDLLPDEGQTCAQAKAGLPADLRDDAHCGRSGFHIRYHELNDPQCRALPRSVRRSCRRISARIVRDR